MSLYTIFLLRTLGNSFFAFGCLASSLIFFFHRGKNGINKLTGLFLFCLFLRSSTIAFTGLLAIFTQTLSYNALKIYHLPWIAETLSIWLVFAVLVYLSLYLKLHKGE
jgi:hypothetical protein